MDIIKTSGLHIPYSYNDINTIKSNLTRTLYEYDGSRRIIRFYEEFDNEIIIPRYYNINETIIDNSNIGDDIEIESNIIPRNNRQINGINYIINNNNGILKLEPGSGKTVIAIAAISTIKKRTIIITHKSKLLDNWESEFKQFTNITSDDILRLSTSNYKDITKYKIILSTPNIFVYAYNNNLIDFIQYIKTKSNIGMLIVDECHVGIGPEKFSLSSLCLNTRRNYGLSATPFRFDNNNDIINMHLGETIYYKPEENELIKPMVYIMKLDYNVYNKYKKYINWGGRFNISRYYNQLYKSEYYVKFLSTLINKLFKENRTILVLGERLDFLLHLAKECNIDKSFIGMFLPTFKDREKKKSKKSKKYIKVLDVSDTDDLDISFNEKRIVFSTYLACRDGNNRKDLDTLIMTTPTNLPEQAIGRIQRYMENKKQPMVFDLVDIGGPIKSYYNKKLDKYTKSEYFISSLSKRLELYDNFKWDYKIINAKELEIKNDNNNKREL